MKILIRLVLNKSVQKQHNMIHLQRKTKTKQTFKQLSGLSLGYTYALFQKFPKQCETSDPSAE